ncbi:15538_t:CDS:2 [Rhizophagus irregularis]|nr:15538_t:CDS:2 [Rhizophagus irregularis]
MFLDQFTSGDGYHLLTWKEIKRQNSTNFKGKIPHSTHKDNTVKISKITPNEVSKPIAQWTAHWNNVIKNVVMGKTLTQDSTESPYLEHFVEVTRRVLPP